MKVACKHLNNVHVFRYFHAFNDVSCHTFTKGNLRMKTKNWDNLHETE